MAKIKVYLVVCAFPISGGFPPLLPLNVIPKWLFVTYVGPGDMFRVSFIWFLAIAIGMTLLLSRTNFGNCLRKQIFLQ